MIRHLSDTRLAEGRVRFLLEEKRVLLLAEGPGWSHRSSHSTLERAALSLALLPGVSQALYEGALAELERQAEAG